MEKIKDKFFNKKFLKEFLLINIGVFLTALSFSIVQDPYNLACGGVSGISILLKPIVHDVLPSSVVILILNIICLILGLIFIGRDFFIKTTYGSLVYPLYTFLSEIIYKYVLQEFKCNPEDFLLIVLIGAALTGIGMGLTIRNGGSTGGIDVIQKMFLKWFKMPFSMSLYILDGTVVLLSGIIFKNYTMILYSFLFILVSGYVVDLVVFGGFNVRAVYIISNKNEEIKQCIIKEMERTVTEVYSRGGYHGIDGKMLVCILTSREYYKLRSVILETDPKAFVFVTKATEVCGEGFTYESSETN